MTGSFGCSSSSSVPAGWLKRRPSSRATASVPNRFGGFDARGACAAEEPVGGVLEAERADEARVEAGERDRAGGGSLGRRLRQHRRDELLQLHAGEGVVGPECLRVAAEQAGLRHLDDLRLCPGSDRLRLGGRRRRCEHEQREERSEEPPHASYLGARPGILYPRPVELEITPEPTRPSAQAIELALERVETERNTGVKAVQPLARGRSPRRDRTRRAAVTDSAVRSLSRVRCVPAVAITRPAREDDEFCPICLISIKVEVARGMQQLSEYLRALGCLLGLVRVARSAA